MKKLAIGVDDFKKLRDYNACFVDKSLYIEEVIEDISEVLLFPRLRRFGKILNIRMLQYFFSNKNTEENRKLFDGQAITNSPVFAKHQGQCPVVTLSFKSCKDYSYENVGRKTKEVEQVFQSFLLGMTFNGKRVWAKTKMNSRPS